MNARDVMDEVLTKDTLSYMMAYYESYYQIALGFMVSYSSGFDTVDATTRIKNLNLKLHFRDVVEEILESSFESDDLDSIAPHLKSLSARKALDDLLHHDTDILNKPVFRDIMLENIHKGVFFTKELEKMFQESLPLKITVWKRAITQKSIDQARDRMVRLFDRRIHTDTTLLATPPR